MKRLLFVVVITALMAGCTDDKGAKRVLGEQGFTDIALTGYDVWACSDSDTFSTGFTATNSAGKRVKGTVCNGFMKGYTIRFH